MASRNGKVERVEKVDERIRSLSDMRVIEGKNYCLGTWRTAGSV
jgi:hypothetical protein